MDQCHLYIVLVRTNTAISKLIRLFKRDRYTHAAISLDRELNHMYSFGRRWAFNPFVGCFRKEDVNKGVYRYQREVPCEILELDIAEPQYDKARCLIAQFIADCGDYGYNYKGLMYGLFNTATRDTHRFLCSEFVYYVLRESGIADLKKSRNLVRPQDLLAVGGRAVYRGDLKQWKARDAECGEGWIFIGYKIFWGGRRYLMKGMGWLSHLLQGYFPGA